MPNVIDTWNAKAKTLEGRTIKRARYLTKQEADALGWSKLVLVMELDDGTLLYPSMDDEGNDGGALFGQRGKADLTFPVIGTYLCK